MVVDFIAFVFVIFLSRMEEIVVAVMLLKRAALLRVFVFFFSSRRRHTISLCDWSSDVCSSDLAVFARPTEEQRDDAVCRFCRDPVPAHVIPERRVRLPQLEEFAIQHQDARVFRLMELFPMQDRKSVV